MQQWLKTEALEHAHIVKPSPLPSHFVQTPKVSWSSSPDQISLNYNPDIVVLAVRPKDVHHVAPLYTRFQSSLFISIVAGKTLETLSLLLSPSPALLRIMPNIACAIGQGTSFAIYNSHVSPAQKQSAFSLFKVTGATFWIEDEALFDKATTLSGCGPGYVLALVESMALAGEKLGLSAELSLNLAWNTVTGSAALLQQREIDLISLRQTMHSIGPMTEAALQVLQSPETGLYDLMLNAMKAALNLAQKH